MGHSNGTRGEEEGEEEGEEDGEDLEVKVEEEKVEGADVVVLGFSLTLIWTLSEACLSLDSHQYHPLSQETTLCISHKDPLSVPQASHWVLVSPLGVFLVTVQPLSQLRDNESPLKNWDRSGLTRTEALFGLKQVTAVSNRSCCLSPILAQDFVEN